MLFVLIFAIFCILLLAYMRFEASLVEVQHIAFTKAKNHLKILQLSDIHMPLLKVAPQKVKKMIAQENPDLIFITGDYIEKPHQIPDFLNFLRLIKGHYPTFLCLGNHDYTAFLNNEEGLQDYINRIESTGVTILHNQCAQYEKGGKKYNIIGIADLRYRYHDVAKALADCPKDAFLNVAFSHNPDIVLEIPKGKVDYLFCGHFHGGQIWAPFDLEFKLLRNEKLCKMNIKRGLHKVNGINLYINRGLGNVVFPFRLFSRPEITVYYLP